jgi:hypothetical protein
MIQSPELAPSDFHLFLHFTKHLAGQTIDEDNMVEKEASEWLRAHAAQFCDVGTQKLVHSVTNALTRVVIMLRNI